MIRLLPQERRSIAQYIHSICAITLDPSKDYLIESRLGGLMEEFQCSSFAQLVNLSKSDPGGKLRRRVIDEITTNETSFFRDTAVFDLLRFKILPELVDRRKRAGRTIPLRIWSAACSTGQEIYSIAIVLKEVLGSLSGYDIRLLGTDISDQAIARASEAVYSPMEIARGLTDAAREKSFVPHARGWRILDEIRGMASFRKLNLVENFSSLGKFDIVFCRNVAIYFDARDRACLFQRIGQRLDDGGCLVIGSMESLSGTNTEFEAKRHLGSVFYQMRQPARAA